MNETQIKIGLALSGGGSRAIAFHLGCLKALNKYGILGKVNVISSVSGGSVISALYSYSQDSFDEFEKRIRAILQRGLQKDLLLQLFRIDLLVLIIFNFLLFAVSAFIILVLKYFLILIYKLTRQKIPRWLSLLRTPFQRKYNLLYLFERMLAKKYFSKQKIHDRTRKNLSVVINACELRTGTAMRFGNMESGCWRFGEVKDNNVKVATAVAASAAFPVLLPSQDRNWLIVDRYGNEKLERLILTDGGVYDNLGVSCLEPDKNNDYSYNAYSCDYIICCNAGQGQFPTTAYPNWWATRMLKSFLSVFRKNMDSYAQKLHNYKKTNQIKGFVYSYLGLQDHNLEKILNIPAGYIKREEVINYPTNFAKMKSRDMELLIQRGEQITELLIKHYHPELITDHNEEIHPISTYVV